MKEQIIEEILEAGSRMAQDLQEFVDEAEAAGGNNALPGTVALIGEWEACFKAAVLEMKHEK